MTLRSILVATDFSEYARHAALRAGRLARELGARRVVLMHVAPRFAFSAADRARAHRTLRGELAAQAREVEARTGTACAVRLAQGGGAVAALARAAAGFDLVVVGGQGRHPLRDFALGTTAERLLRKVRRPVLFVKAAPAAPYAQALVPVDFSADARAALELARALAPGAELTALHAFDVPIETKLRTAGVSEDHVLQYRTRMRERAAAELDALLGASGVRAAAQVRHGYPPQVIASAQSELGADLVAIGKHGRSALEDLLLGSVTLRTLASAGCDVLVVPARRGRRARKA